MSSSRPKLMFDEQSFQDMLEAAYIIQEHNAKRQRARRPQRPCGKCAAPVEEGQTLCPTCAAEEFRPGEKLQQKWASMWLMSQEQGLWPENPQTTGQEETPSPAHDDDSAIPSRADHLLLDAPETDADFAQQALQSAHPDLDEQEGEITALELPGAAEPEVAIEKTQTSAVIVPRRGSFADLRLTLRFHRADLYLVAAIIISTFAMLWVLLATPTVGAQHTPRLRPWERALVSLGLADAPDPPSKRGNPAAQVWVDPKTALYYCYGDEQYGRTPGGHQATQREAQLDSFEPAARVACE